jgi:hypothetical protein
MKYAPFQRIIRLLFVLNILSISVQLSGQISNVEFKSKNLKDNLKNITDTIIQNNFINNTNFSFTLTKKQTI